MTRENIIKLLAEDLGISRKTVEQAFIKLHDEIQKVSVKDLIENALENYELTEYRACKSFLDYILIGDE